MRVLILGTFVLVFGTGCASKPIAPELEELVVRNCAEGCAVIPAPLWLQIINALQAKGVAI